MHTTRPNTHETLQPGLRRVLADNPSPMTYWGTNTYIVGTGNVAVIDPGPDSPAHLRAILSALEPGETISHIFVTHSHVDHSPLAPTLSAQTGAPILAYGDATAGRSAVMCTLANQGMTDGGEGIDAAFTPDQTLKDGQTITADNWRIQALWTPGHLGNHMCFIWGDVIFTGDHIMAWASSLVSPPDGDLSDFMASTEKLSQHPARIFYPGHGPAVTDPAARISWLLKHRQSRQTAILSALSHGPATTQTLTQMIYTDIQPHLLPAAQRNVFAHLIDLVQSAQAQTNGLLTFDAEFALNGPLT